MRKIISLAVLLALTLGLVSCEDKKVYNGTMVYSQKYIIKENSYAGAVNSELADIYMQIQTEIGKLGEKYEKTWPIKYAGATLDEGLKESDNKSMADFDKATASMDSLVQVFTPVLSQDHGKGTLKIVTRFVISRDKTVKESTDFTFQYKPVASGN